MSFFFTTFACFFVRIYARIFWKWHANDQKTRCDNRNFRAVHDGVWSRAYAC